MMPEKLRGWSSPFGCFIRAQRQFSAHSMPLLCPCERTGQVGPVLETDLTIEGRTKNSLCRPKLENIGPTCAAQTHTHHHRPSGRMCHPCPEVLFDLFSPFVIFKFLFPLSVMFLLWLISFLYMGVFFFSNTLCVSILTVTLFLVPHISLYFIISYNF